VVCSILSVDIVAPINSDSKADKIFVIIHKFGCGVTY